MMYTRAQGEDFDSWATPGWTAKDMLPICNKLETYHVKGDAIDQSKHGHDGPVHISDGGYRGKSENEFLKTVEGMGFKVIEDLQDFDAVGGFSVSLFCVLRVFGGN
jgi:alcohol oxidase